MDDSGNINDTGVETRVLSGKVAISLNFFQQTEIVQC